MHRTENIADLIHRFSFFPVERAEILHKRNVIAKLREIAHTGKDHHDPVEPGGKADGVTCGRSAVKIFQHFFCIFGQIHEVSALYRFHHDDGFPVLAAHLVTFFGLHRRIFEIDVVQLDLHDFHLRIFGQDLVKHFRRIVERNTHVLHLSRRFQLERMLVRVAFFIFLEYAFALRVHQIKIEILHPAGLELFFKQRQNILFFLKKACGKFVRQNETLPRISLCDTLADRRFALPAEIYPRRIEIIKAFRHKDIDHLRKLPEIDFVSLHRQTHTAEPEILFHLFE